MNLYRNNLIIGDIPQLDVVVPSFIPFSTDGLNLWLDAEKITGLSAGAQVSQWDDASGNNNHATQGTSSARPTYQTNVLNGKPVVRFDGSNDNVSIASGVFNGMSTQVSIFIVASSSASKLTSIFVALTDQIANRFCCHLPWSNGTLYWDFGDIANNGRVDNAWGGSVNTHYLWSLLAGSGMAIRRNSTQLASTANSSTFTPGTKTLRLGYYDGSVYWGGDIAEMIIYNRRLTPTEITQVETYLKNKYNL